MSLSGTVSRPRWRDGGVDCLENALTKIPKSRTRSRANVNIVADLMFSYCGASKLAVEWIPVSTLEHPVNSSKQIAGTINSKRR
jgi:hypothetical protein